MRFRDRVEAGQRLAHLLKRFHGATGIIYALPRGGVVLGAQVARALDMPLDLLIPRKIGHPYQPEYAIGAVTESGEMIVNEQEVAGVDPHWFHEAVAAERNEARRRRELYLGGRDAASAAGKTAIIVDDGIATGLTMEVAIRDAKRHNPARLVVAVPAAPHATIARLLPGINEFVVIDTTEHYLGSVGAYYERFPQVSDSEVIALMRTANAPRHAPDTGPQ